MKPAKNSVAAVDGLYRSVRKVIEEGSKVVSVAVNAVLVRQNWFIGKLIVEDEQKGRREIETQKEPTACRCWMRNCQNPSGRFVPRRKAARNEALAFN